MYIGKQIELTSAKTFQAVLGNTLLNKVSTSELVEITYNTSQNVSSIIINTKTVNIILEEANNILQEFFDQQLTSYFEDLEIPLGTLISKSLFSSRGPIIKIPITPVGSYKVDVSTNTVPYGINNSLIEVFLKINVDIEALVPLQTRLFPNETKIIILSQTILGEIPKYYYASGDTKNFPYIPEG